MRGRVFSLYSRIAALYLLLLLTFVAIATALAARQLEAFLEELEQRLNRNLAQHLALELEPSFAEGVRTPRAQQAIDRIANINPGIELYVLSESGEVLATFTGRHVTHDRVDLEPIRKFLSADAMLPLRATDPQSAQEQRVFSAARVHLGSTLGYVYVILLGMPAESMANMLRTSYIARDVGGTLLVVLLATGAAGLLFFALLTQRFRKLIATVKKFQGGALHERADVDVQDQIGRLGAAFNEMAATIESQVDALKRTDEARRALAANISHDFRTPLTSLRGYTERMLNANERIEPAQRREYLTAALKNAEQLEHLADQLAALVQLDAGASTTPRMEPFSIAELAQDVAAKFAPLAERLGVKIELPKLQELPAVSGDISLVERALSNLIDNALNNTPRGGSIELHIEASNQRVTVTVRDNGKGIPQDELPLVTQRFYRTRESRASGHRGSGLGLAIVREILEMHRSTLTIESRVGVGTTVTFSLSTAAV